MGRVDRQERGRLWAWVYLALFDGGETDCHETGAGPGVARDADDEPADDRSGE